MGDFMETGLTNLSRFLLEEQRTFTQASGDLTLILQQIALAGKLIGAQVSRAGIVDILGESSSKNIFGEVQQKLDLFSHNTMISVLDHIGKLCGMASEESDNLIRIPTKHPSGKYLAVFDPLDGSSNIDVNISIGTIFGIYRKLDDKTEGCNEEDFLQPGKELVSAGYIIYGSSTMFVYSTGCGVNGFTLDPGLGEFILSHPNIKIPECGSIYSVNEAYRNTWDSVIRNFISHIRKNKNRRYRSRYIGALVPDFHRNLLKGGIFMYPGDSVNPEGKLRLLYEANPMAFIVDQAGGKATNGKNDILDIKLNSIHQRTPLFIGSKYEVELLRKILNEEVKV